MAMLLETGKQHARDEKVQLEGALLVTLIETLLGVRIVEPLERILTFPDFADSAKRANAKILRGEPVLACAYPLPRAGFATGRRHFPLAGR